MKTIKIYCDGGSRNGNGSKENYGSVASLIKLNENSSDNYDNIIRKGFKDVTNNQMELLGFILPLSFLNKTMKNENLKIIVYSDSQYLTKGINNWLPNWIKKNWKTASNNPVKNNELWKIINYYLSKPNYNYEINWIKGHNGHPLNEEADSFCTKTIQEMDKSERIPEDFNHVIELVQKNIK